MSGNAKAVNGKPSAPKTSIFTDPKSVASTDVAADAPAHLTITADIANASNTAKRLRSMPKEERFAGDINCEEADEPLLKENHKRFVLFPIQYNEVFYMISYMDIRPDDMPYLDLAGVQESRSILLDR